MRMKAPPALIAVFLVVFLILSACRKNDRLVSGEPQESPQSPVPGMPAELSRQVQRAAARFEEIGGQGSYAKMFEKRFGSPLWQHSIIISNGDRYAVTVTDYNKAATFLYTKNQYLSGSAWNETSPVEKAFENAYGYYFDKVYKSRDATTKRNLSYEMAMAAVLNSFNTGITLHKKDPATGKFKPIVIKTVIPNPNKPRKKEYVQDCL